MSRHPGKPTDEERDSAAEAFYGVDQPMLSRHTAGPWEVVRHAHIDDELWLSVNQHADAQGMKEWIAEIKYLTTDPERQWANARLIAAAPDLLAALKLIESVYRLNVVQAGEPSSVMEAAQAAISKAEGRS